MLKLKKTRKQFLSISVLIIFIFIAFGSQKAEDKKSEGTTSKENGAVDGKEGKKEVWSYSENVDKMTNQKKYYAEVISTNKIEFEFPYNGGSTFTIQIRNSGNGNEASLRVSKGQFLPSIMNENTVKIKFDNNAAYDLNYGSEKTGKSDVIFLAMSDQFIQQMKTAKKLMIECEFFNEGKKIIDFDVEGLKWER
jgi:hypothetical protein